jgi:tetratricopeptide (TPR) repeat protein
MNDKSSHFLFYPEKNPRLQKLIAMYEENRKDTFLTYAIALEMKAMGEAEQAELWLCRTLDLDSNHVPSYFQLGKLMVDLDEIDKAVNWLEEGIEVAQSVNDQKAMREMKALLDEILY